MEIKEMNFREVRDYHERTELLKRFVPDYRDYDMLDTIPFLAVEVQEGEYVILKARHKLSTDIEFKEVKSIKEAEIDSLSNNRELMFIIKK